MSTQHSGTGPSFLLVNARGLNSTSKQSSLLLQLEGRKPLWVFVTETRLQSTQELSPHLKKWVVLHSLAPPNDAGAGLLVLKNPTLPGFITPGPSPPIPGRALPFTLTSPLHPPLNTLLLYGPHLNKPTFWTSLPFDPTLDLVLGDFNFISLPEDGSNPRSTQHWDSPWLESGLTDIFAPPRPDTFMSSKSSSTSFFLKCQWGLL